MSDIFIFSSEDGKSKNEEKKKGFSFKKGDKSLIDSINDYLLDSQSIKVKEKVVFYRMLATMVNSGISILKAISILEEQEANPVLKKILGKIRDSLKKGNNLSVSLADFPTSFDDAEIGIIESGEKTGKLNGALLTLADQVEKVSGMSGKIKSALMYPAMIMVVVFGVVIVLMVKVVPNLLEIFEDKSQLPPSTQLLIAISEFLQNYWWLLIIGIILLIIGLGIWKKTPQGKYGWDMFCLKAPVFGDINRKVILGKFSRVLSGLLSSGVSIVESLRITSSAVGNEVYKQRLMLLREDIKKGIKIWEGIDGDPLFPIMLVQMIQVGEQTAQVDKIIIKLADFYDEEVNNKVGMINKLLEPFIIVFMAVIVGFIAIAIMQPMMNIADQVTSK